VPWHTLPRNLLELQFDSLNLERFFETGITDPDSVANTERLSDYYDDQEESVRPLLERYTHTHKPLPLDACLGSRQPAEGDVPQGTSRVICSVCGQSSWTYPRKHPRGKFRSTHRLAESEGPIQ
jgi:hypothetical protein